MNELLKALGLKHVEKGLPELCEQAKMHSLTYETSLLKKSLLSLQEYLVKYLSLSTYRFVEGRNQ